MSSTSAELEQAAAQATLAPHNPFIRVGNLLYHELEVAKNRDGSIRRVKRRVAEFIDQAQMQGIDYYHPGAVEGISQGEIIDSSGRVLGRRTKPGWFLYGHKWQNDGDEIVSLLPPVVEED